MLWPVARHDYGEFVRLESEGLQTSRRLAHFVSVLAPRPRAPCAIRVFPVVRRLVGHLAARVFEHREHGLAAGLLVHLGALGFGVPHLSPEYTTRWWAGEIDLCEVAAIDRDARPRRAALDRPFQLPRSGRFKRRPRRDCKLRPYRGPRPPRGR